MTNSLPTSLQVRTDFSEREVVETPDESWVSSPSPGVERKMLDRLGGEVAVATSIVRFAPGSSFDLHTHLGGEEFLVLDGTFSDQQGDFSAGSYIRNAPGSSHAPFTHSGCTIFVKLRHFSPGDTQDVAIDTRKQTFLPGQVKGLSVLPLHQYQGVSTALVRWEPGCVFVPHRHWGGEEVLVLDGVFSDEHGDYPTGTWIRSPHLSRHFPYSKQGCLIYVKTGHLTSM